jgi:hypothetical protein
MDVLMTVEDFASPDLRYASLATGEDGKVKTRAGSSGRLHAQRQLAGDQFNLSAINGSLEVRAGIALVGADQKAVPVQL